MKHKLFFNFFMSLATSNTQGKTYRNLLPLVVIFMLGLNGVVGQETIISWDFTTNNNPNTNLPNGTTALSFNTGGTIGTSGCTVTGFSSNGWHVNEYLQIVAPTTGYTITSLSFNAKSSNTGPWNFKFQYSSTGIDGTFLDLGTTFQSTNSSICASYSANFSGIYSLHNNSNTVIRIVFTGGEADGTPSTGDASGTGTFRLDDLVITGIANATTYTTFWSNSTPTASIDAIIDGNLTTTADLVCKDLTINSGKSLTIGAGKKLTVSGNLINNGTIIFKSDVNGSAIFDVFNGTQSGTGLVTTERYIPSGKRAFRLLSPAVTTTNFISGNWQLATHITGGASGGFDATETNNPSMYTYNNQVASGTGWTPIANTDATNLTAGVGYRVLVRGDRTPSNITAATTDNMNAAITLSATGTLKTGTVTLNSSSTPAINNQTNVTTADFSLVGNPYQSATDWHLVTKTGIDDTYYAWDPNMGTGAQRGRYVAYNISSGSNNNLSDVDQFIQPGQAFFVKNTTSGSAGTLTFEESDKATTSTNVFKTDNASLSNLTVALYEPNELAIGGYSIDAMKAVFSSDFTNEIGLGDATKLEAAGENMAWFRNNTKLAIDALAPLTNTDELLVKTLRLGANKNYTFKIETANFDTTLTPYLVDNFLNIQTEITTSQAFLASFATTTNAASYSENRFKIVFTNSTLNSNSFTYQINLYPNPSKGNGFNLQLPSTTQATVKLYNTLGQEIGLTTNGSYYQATQSLPKGVYHILVTQGSQISKLKWIVE